MAEKNYITPDGYKRLCDELNELATVERPRVVRVVSDAAAEGDRSENAAYIYGKKRLREIDRRMRFLQKRLKDAQIVDGREQRRDRVFFGAAVEVEDEEGAALTYRIVGPDETDAPQGWISIDSPLARAVLRKRVDDEFSAELPGGRATFVVVEVSYES